MNALDINCERLVSLTTGYMEARIPESERLGFELHLVVCPLCLVHLEELRETIGLVSGLQGASPDPDRRQTLLAALPAEGTAL